MSAKDIQRKTNSIGSEMAKICEYYLKGLLLPYFGQKVYSLAQGCNNKSYTIKENGNEIELNLDDEKLYNFIIGVLPVKEANTIKKLISSQTDESINQIEDVTMRGMGHRLDKLLEKCFEISPEVSQQLIGVLQKYFDRGENSYICLNDYHGKKSDEIKSKIDEESVKDSFPRGRYAFLESEFTSDIETLYKFMQALRETACITTGAITLKANDKNNTCVRMIFPDGNSKIYILDQEDNLSSLYTVANNMSNQTNNVNVFLLDDNNENEWYSIKIKEDIPPKADFQNVDQSDFNDEPQEFYIGNNTYTTEESTIDKEFDSESISKYLFINIPFPTTGLIQEYNINNSSSITTTAKNKQFGSVANDILELNPTSRQTIIIRRAGKYESYCLESGEFYENNEIRTKALEQRIKQYEEKATQFERKTFEPFEEQLPEGYFDLVIDDSKSLLQELTGQNKEQEH